MNYSSCPPIVMASQYSQELSHYDYILKIISCTIMLLLIIPVTSLNVLVILTIIKTPSLQNPSFILICSLALTDFGSGIAAFPINASWRIVEFVDRSNANVCSTFDVGFAIAFTLLSSSELTITALSIDRYLSIRLSRRYRQQVTNRRVVIVVVLSWCTAVVWGVTSVFITPKVLHTTVVVIGIITFGAIFFCYALAVKALLGQEARTGGLKDRPTNVPASKSALTLEEEAAQELATSPRCQPMKRNVPLKMNVKISPSEANEGTAENQDEVSTPLQSQITEDIRRTPEVVELEFEELRVQHSHHSRHHCDIADEKDGRLSVIYVSTSSEDNSKSNAKEQRKESNCSMSICVSISETRPAHEDLKQKSTNKGSVDNNVAEKTNSRQKRFIDLRKVRSGAGRSVKLVKYRYTVVTLLWVIVMFILCYAPYFLLSFMVAFTGMTNDGAVAWSIAIAVICTNSLINPVIYLWRLRILRKSCWNILKGTCC